MLQRKSHIKISSCLRELQPLLLKQSEKFHSSINKRSRYFENNVHQDLFMFKGTTCHHVTGECLPCAPGLWGEGCKEKCKWVILLKKLQKVENRCHIHHHHHLWTLGSRLQREQQVSGRHHHNDHDHHHRRHNHHLGCGGRGAKRSQWSLITIMVVITSEYRVEDNKGKSHQIWYERLEDPFVHD